MVNYSFSACTDFDIQKLYSKLKYLDFFLGFSEEDRIAIRKEFKKRNLKDLGAITVKFTGNVPVKKSEGAGAWDLMVDKFTTINPGETKIVPTGTYMEIPPGYRLRLSLRSGVGTKSLIMPNATGLIDSDYRGELGVIVYNGDKEKYTFREGDRIAQCWLEQEIPIEWELVPKLTATERGQGGFGSTGK